MQVRVLLCSTKAASLGLNLECACRVIILDVWWNGAYEDQAADRCHRLRQTRPVQACRCPLPTASRIRWACNTDMLSPCSCACICLGGKLVKGLYAFSIVQVTKFVMKSKDMVNTVEQRIVVMQARSIPCLPAALQVHFLCEW